MYVFNPGHLRRKKQTRPLTWIRTFPWEAAFTSSSSFCPGSFSNHDCGGITSASWDYTSRGASTAPSPAPNTPTGRRTLKSEKGRPLLSFVSGEMQDNQLLRGDQSIKLLLLLWSTLLSSYKFPQILLTQVCGLHWLAPLRPLQSRTCCLSVDWCWASALTNGPGAASLTRPPLRIPWSTSSTPHCCSHRAKRELCGRAPGRSFPNAGHVTLMGNRWKPLGQWFRFFLNHFSEYEPLEVRSPLQEVMNLQVWSGAMKWVFSKFPVCSDASPPRPTLRSPDLQPSRSAQLRPLRRGGFRVGISEGCQARTRQRKLQYLGFRPF